MVRFLRRKPKTTNAPRLAARAPESPPTTATRHNRGGVQAVTRAERKGLTRTVVKSAAVVGAPIAAGFAIRKGAEGLADLNRSKGERRLMEREAQRQEAFGFDTDGDGAVDSYVLADPSGRLTTYGEEPSDVGEERTPGGATGAIREGKRFVLVAGVLVLVGAGGYALWKSGALGKAAKKARGGAA